jgi:hypothetical protein
MALYLPAVSSLRYNPQQMAFYARLRARQASGKPGVISVMRKLLLLCYSLWKNDQPYDPHFHPAGVAQKEIAPATSANRGYTGCTRRSSFKRSEGKKPTRFLASHHIILC